MEVKNVSETPFLFGFTASSSGVELPEGEFASVLAGVNEPGTTLSTKAEVVGTEPIAPLQILDLPELGQGDIGYDLVSRTHGVVDSFVNAEGDKGVSLSGIEKGLAAVQIPSEIHPANDARGFASADDSSEVVGTNLAQNPGATGTEELLSQEGPLEEEVLDLRSLISAEIRRSQPTQADISPIVVAFHQHGVIPHQDSEFTGGGPLGEKQDSSQILSLESLANLRNTALEIASGIQQVGQTFESLRQLLGSAVNEGRNAVEEATSLLSTANELSEGLPSLENGVQIIPASVGSELPDKATFLQISEALGIVGISISEETSLESDSPYESSIEGEESSIGHGETTAGSGEVSARKLLVDVSAATIKSDPESVASAAGESPTALHLDLSSIGRQPDSVKQAVAYTWAALDKEANSAVGQKKVSQISLGTSVSVPGGNSPEPSLLSSTRRPENGGSQVLLQGANSVSQHQSKVPTESMRGVAPAQIEWDLASETVPAVDSGIHGADASWLVGMKAVSEGSATPIASAEASSKVSDGRLTIEGNHSLMEIRSETVRKVAEHLDRLLVTRSKSESVIRMQPEELGSITMVVRNVKSDIEAVVTASDERVRELLHDSRQDLIHNLHQKGHSEVRVTVAAEATSADRQSSNRDSSHQQDQGQRPSFSQEYGSSSNGQSFSREQDRQGSYSNRAFRPEDERSLRAETTPSKKSETFRRFQKVIDVAI